MIRFAEPQDAAQLAEWSASTPHNGLNTADASLCQLTFVVEDTAPLIYVPCHLALVIGSVACRPEITGRQYIEALRQAKSATEDFARRNRLREIHTSSVYEPAVKTFCRHGYQPIAGTALRKRIQ